MGDSSRKFDINIGAAYSGSGAMKSVTADVKKLREELSIPVMGPLTRFDQQIEAQARTQIMAAERAADRVRVSEEVYNRTGLGKALPRFTEAQQAMRKRQAEIARDWRNKDRAAQAEEINREFSRPEREGRASLIERMKKGITPEMTEELKKTQEQGKGLLGLLDKMGLAQGPTRLANRLKEIAPHIGAALAAVKAVTIALEISNYAADKARHHEQGDLAAEADDERKQNEMASSMSFGFGPQAREFLDRHHIPIDGLRRFVPFIPRGEGNYYEDKVHIEEMTLATKRQEALMARQKSNADVFTTARLASRDANVGIEAAIAGRFRTPEDQAVIAANTQVAMMKRKIAELPIGKVPDEMKAELVNRERIVNLAIENEAIAHRRTMARIESETGQSVLEAQEDWLGAKHAAMSRAMKEELDSTMDLRQKAAMIWKDTIKFGTTFFQEYTDKQAFLNAAAGEAREMILRFEGKGLQADIDQIHRERDAAMNKEFDPEKREAIKKKAQAAEDVKNGEADRDRLGETYDYQQKELDTYSTHKERLLRLSGDHFSADKEQLSRQRADRFAEIDKELRANLAKRDKYADEYRARAKQEEKDANDEFAVGTLESQIRLARAYRARPTNTTPEGDNRLLTGVGGQIKEGATIQIELLKQILTELRQGKVLKVPSSN